MHVRCTHPLTHRRPTEVSISATWREGVRLPRWEWSAQGSTPMFSLTTRSETTQTYQGTYNKYLRTHIGWQVYNFYVRLAVHVHSFCSIRAMRLWLLMQVFEVHTVHVHWNMHTIALLFKLCLSTILYLSMQWGMAVAEVTLLSLSAIHSRDVP